MRIWHQSFTDLTVMPLEFEGIRRTFPTLTALGSVSGPVRLAGRLDSVDLWADLQGELGRVQAEGRVAMLPPRWQTDSLRLELTGLDVRREHVGLRLLREHVLVSEQPEALGWWTSRMRCTQRARRLKKVSCRVVV